MKYLGFVEQLQSANQGHPHGFISVSALPQKTLWMLEEQFRIWVFFSLCQIHQWGILQNFE